MQDYDVIVVGGGPAGLSAALVLGRCLRKVLICDSGQPRNAASHALHGYLTRDNTSPGEFLNIARSQFEQYKTVTYLATEIINVLVIKTGFEVVLKDQTRKSCRKLLLATGVVDNLPEFAGFEGLYGSSIFHCPYCDAWEFRGRPIVVYGNGSRGHALSLDLKNWTNQVTLCTDGPAKLSAEEKLDLEKHSVTILEDKIASIQSSQSKIQKILFTNGNTLDFAAMFFTLGQKQRSNLPEQLGCEFSEKGAVKTDSYQVSCVPNLYVAGDASEELQLVIVAAAEGAKAAFAINKSILKEDLHS